MSIFEPSRSPWTGRMLSILRIVAGSVFITFGTMKLFNFPPLPAGMPPIPLMSQLGLAGTLESFGGLLIILGLFTRFFAAGIAIEMAIIAFKVKMPLGFGQMELFLLWGIVMLAIALRGGGPYSLDRKIGKEL